MKCHKLNNLNFIARRWHRLWCGDCRKAQHLDTMIGFGLMQMKSAPGETSGLEMLLASPLLPEGGRTARRASRQLAGNWLRHQTRLAATALIVGGVWWQYMSYTPPMTIPAKIAPEQNAFDYFKMAGIMAAANKDLSSEVDEARQKLSDPPTRERRDARLKREGKSVPSVPQLMQMMAHEAAQKSRSATGDMWAYDVVPDKSTPVYDSKTFRMPYTQEEKQQLLDDNRLALTVLREGFKHPYMDVYPRRFDALFPDYSNFRQMARLLSLETEVKAAKGDWNGAMQSSLDAMQMGVEITHGAPMIGRLVGNACEIIGEQGAWKAVGHLDARGTRTALARLQAIRARYLPFAETLQEEAWFMQESLRDEMAKPGWRGNFMALTGSSESKGFAPVMLGWSNRVVLKDIAGMMDENIRRSRLPYAQSSRLPEIKAPFDPIAMVMFPLFSGARYQDTYGGETQSALLATTLALSAYRLEHGGRLPDRLEQLTPQYLAQVPADPFSADGNAPLRYRKAHIAQCEDDTIAALDQKPEAVLPGAYPCVLYSVGPDGRDDGGNPVDLLHQPQPEADGAWRRIASESPQRYQVLQIATGDIVAGVNTR